MNLVLVTRGRIVIDQVKVKDDIETCCETIEWTSIMSK